MGGWLLFLTYGINWDFVYIRWITRWSCMLFLKFSVNNFSSLMTRSLWLELMIYVENYLGNFSVREILMGLSSGISFLIALEIDGIVLLVGVNFWIVFSFKYNWLGCFGCMIYGNGFEILKIGCTVFLSQKTGKNVLNISVWKELWFTFRWRKIFWCIGVIRLQIYGSKF